MVSNFYTFSPTTKTFIIIRKLRMQNIAGFFCRGGVFSRGLVAVPFCRGDVLSRGPFDGTLLSRRRRRPSVTDIIQIKIDLHNVITLQLELFSFIIQSKSRNQSCISKSIIRMTVSNIGNRIKNSQGKAQTGKYRL